MKKEKLKTWAVRFCKGIFIGTGFILPGVSGGVLAAILGIYQRMISFIANIRKNFKENLWYFLPVGIGMLVGIIVLSFPLSFFLDKYPAYTIWFFIGAIAGTIPSLWAQAGEQGREKKDIIIMVFACILGFIFLKLGASLINGNVPLNFGTWFIAGCIIAMGILVPGLSPSNFLLYMGMYQIMILAFKTLNINILIPVFLGMMICLLLLSKVIYRFLDRAYAAMFHSILGIVLASTIIIIPINFNYLSPFALICVITFILGTVLGHYMCALEEKYKTA